ncbi:MAG: hypothetical protein V7784_03035 [Oceanospirillaceae bacterium]
MKRVKNLDGTITAYMERSDAFEIIEALLTQLKNEKEVIQLTIVDDQYISAFDTILNN